MGFSDKQEWKESGGEGTTTAFESICQDIIKMQAGKGSGYKQSPLNELPLDVWLAQIQIKATRAKYSTSEEKMLDELKDTATYCILTMMKIKGMTVV